MENVKKKNGMLTSLLDKPMLAGLLVVVAFLIELRVVPHFIHNNMLASLFLIVSSIALYVAFNKVFLPKEINSVKKDGFFKGLMLTSPLWIFSAVSAIVLLFTAKNALTMNYVMETLVTALQAGICEEIICRGLFVGNAMRNKANADHIWRYAIISSACFGLMHLSNLSFGADICATLSQVLTATGSGLIFCAVYYRTGSILPTIAAHSLLDFASFLIKGMNEGVSVTYTVQKDNGFAVGGLIMGVVMLSIYVGYTMFLLRKKKRVQITERIALA